MKEFPLVSNTNSEFPPDGRCAVCGKENIKEPNSMIVISGGALLLDKDGDSIMNKHLEGYFTLIWHGAHDGGIGDYREIYEHLSIAEQVIGGQYSIYLCSFACLRNLFVRFVDELENKIAKKAEQSVQR